MRQPTGQKAKTILRMANGISDVIKLLVSGKADIEDLNMAEALVNHLKHEITQMKKIA